MVLEDIHKESIKSFIKAHVDGIKQEIVDASDQKEILSKCMPSGTKPDFNELRTSNKYSEVAINNAEIIRDMCSLKPKHDVSNASDLAKIQLMQQAVTFVKGGSEISIEDLPANEIRTVAQNCLNSVLKSYVKSANAQSLKQDGLNQSN